MSDNNQQSYGCGIGPASTVFIVFLILKLTHVITWSWWWVTAPLWISTGVVIVGLIIMGIVALVWHLVDR
jgi:hypothetical protein